MQNNNFKKKSLTQWFSEAKDHYQNKKFSNAIEILFKRIFIHFETIENKKIIFNSIILCLFCYYEIEKFKEIVDFYETLVFPYKNNFEIICIVSKTLHNLKDYKKEIQILQNYLNNDKNEKTRETFLFFKNYLLSKAYRKIGDLDLALEKINLSLNDNWICGSDISKKIYNILNFKKVKNFF